MKTCTRCKVQKPYSEFTKRSASKDGHTTACTKCLKKQKRIDYLCEPEKTMTRVRKNLKARMQNDPVYKRAWEQWKYAKSLKRVPKWVKFTRDLLPKYRELLTKFPSMTVDHIIPMQGDIVSGLHVPSNLQVLSCSENSSKGNKFHPNFLLLHDVGSDEI